MAEFSGGKRFEAKLKELTKQVSKPGVLKVGFMGGATYPDGTSVPFVAFMNEFGAPSRGQPPRPFFRRMIAAKSPSWGKSLENLLKSNNYDAPTALKAMGVGISQQLQASIREFLSPPLAASTIAVKSAGQSAKGKATVAKYAIAGPAKPLIDTGLMLKSVTFKIEE